MLNLLNLTITNHAASAESCENEVKAAELTPPSLINVATSLSLSSLAIFQRRVKIGFTDQLRGMFGL